MNRRWLEICVALSGVTLMHCARQSSEARDPDSVLLTPAAGTTPTRGAEALHDGQVLALTQAANEAEIRQANLALERSEHDGVRGFAEMMLRHHGEARDKQSAVARSRGIELADSLVLAQLKTSADSTFAHVDRADPLDFDRFYIRAQVDQHELLLETIDDQLVAGARDPEVESVLTGLRPVAAQHLSEARRLYDVLTTGPRPSPTTPQVEVSRPRR